VCVCVQVGGMLLRRVTGAQLIRVADACECTVWTMTAAAPAVLPLTGFRQLSTGKERGGGGKECVQHSASGQRTPHHFQPTATYTVCETAQLVVWWQDMFGCRWLGLPKFGGRSKVSCLGDAQARVGCIRA
jgi:hypothetical protein